MTRLPRSFYRDDTLTVAKRVLGCVLIHDSREGTTGGIIVETEAYLGASDRASHARFGNTKRSSIMFGPPGFAYVYLIYGIHSMFNVVCEEEGSAGAVLIRALQPTTGLDLMAARRDTERPDKLTGGPARLTRALAIDINQNGADLVEGPLGIWRPAAIVPSEIKTTPRVGVAGSKELPYRFILRGNPYVSR